MAQTLIIKLQITCIWLLSPLILVLQLLNALRGNRQAFPYGLNWDHKSEILCFLLYLIYYGFQSCQMPYEVKGNHMQTIMSFTALEGPQWQSGNTLASHLCGRGSIPVMAVSGKAGSCLPLVGSLQYTTLANSMYWFPLPFQLPVVI